MGIEKVILAFKRFQKFYKSGSVIIYPEYYTDLGVLLDYIGEKLSEE